MSLGGRSWWQDHGQVVLDLRVQSGWSCFWSAAGNMVDESTTVAQACLLKEALLSLGFYWGFATSYLDPKAPTQGLLSMGDCQVFPSVGGCGLGISSSTILLTSLNSFPLDLQCLYRLCQ